MNMLDDVEFQIAKLSLGPHDLLAVRAAKPITSVVATELRSRLERHHNLAGRVLVIDAGVDLTVVNCSATALARSLETKAGPSETRPGRASAAKA